MGFALRSNYTKDILSQPLPFRETLICKMLPIEIVAIILSYLSKRDLTIVKKTCGDLRAIVQMKAFWTEEIKIIMTLAKDKLEKREMIPRNMSDMTLFLGEDWSALSPEELAKVSVPLEMEKPNILVRQFYVEAFAKAWSSYFRENNKKIGFTFTIPRDFKFNTESFEGFLVGLIKLRRINELTINCAMNKQMIIKLMLMIQAGYLNLTSFILSPCNQLLSDEVDIVLMGLAGQKLLTKLELSGCVLNEHRLQTLAFNVSHLKQLRILKLGNIVCSKPNSNAFTNILLLKLEKLEIDQMKGSLLEHLKNILSYITIKKLVIGGEFVDLDYCHHLCHLVPPSEKLIIHYGKCLQEEAVAAIANDMLGMSQNSQRKTANSRRAILVQTL